MGGIRSIGYRMDPGDGNVHTVWESEDDRRRIIKAGDSPDGEVRQINGDTYGREREYTEQLKTGPLEYDIYHARMLVQTESALRE